MKIDIKDSPKRKLNLKKYISPTLIIYGKLTEITAGGRSGVAEGQSGHLDKQPKP